MNKMLIGGKKVDKDSPVLIIAEAGINHDGDYNQALKLIDVASEAGADVVKFQLFKADKMYTKNAGKYITASGKNEEIVELLKSVELPFEWIPKLIDYCKLKNIGFLCTVCDEYSGDVLTDYHVDSFKMASYAITHIPLLKYVAKKQKTMVFSTAGANLSDIEEAIRTIKNEGNEKIALLHCVAKYPAPLETCNMNVLDTFKFAFPDLIIGYSDHTEDPIKAPVTAVYKGAKIIEKHFTIDKNLPGADHSFAVDPIGLREMVRAIRDTEIKIKNKEEVEIDPLIFGTSEKKMQECERSLRRYAYRTVFAIKDIAPNELITTLNTAILRPGESELGIEPKFYEMLIQNKVKANKLIEEGSPVKWDDILNV
ncbi:N-acetylneuraminate synthase family protein [Asaccharospora irregularis]|uniref:Sialic acid synthase SpsE, contains C-terminal SAF domain n=1 Tax=Asaccharospora irregularis DSM 2635 TaxID=1121321 RepID=A0A1M5PF32_9FIRM|nr:N-acetylneuraminate synthase family protein [Asaccharospora irregularis]SHH00424.1 Sialic acid synthase SpsE, contains C-terminal SAF domain [Asaccharospora irregularis DSM 2635]